MFLFFCLDAKEPKNQGFACFATRSLHSAVRIANSRFALKQRCSRPLRSGRSLDAHQPRPILSPASPSVSALRITSFLLLFNPLFNRICNPIVLNIRIFNPIIRYHNPSPLRGAPLKQGSFSSSEDSSLVLRD